MSNRVAAVLKRARGLLVEHGWVRGHIGSKRLGFCAYGAILTATKSGKATAALSDVVKGGDIVLWNDHPRRCKKDVLGGFDRAIKKSLEA